MFKALADTWESQQQNLRQVCVLGETLRWWAQFHFGVGFCLIWLFLKKGEYWN